ncbi:MAG: response regulator transcription factor [Pyrinomonadaceae bacterium]|nr:response regulator transcription factor [Pyrinomonadaceae bacterium]
MNEITIILADDHPIVRKGLREVIEDDRRLKVVAEAGNGGDAVEAVERLKPHVIVLDIDMPVMNGFEAAREIKSRNILTEIVFMTMHRDEEMFNEALDLGAKGFVLKDSALDDIIECIKEVAADRYYASHSLTTFLMNRSRRAIGLSEKQPSINDLTATERGVLKLISENQSSKEIGEQMFISPRTVEKHRANICRKLDLRGSHSLIKFAVLNKSKLL